MIVLSRVVAGRRQQASDGVKLALTAMVVLLLKIWPRPRCASAVEAGRPSQGGTAFRCLGGCPTPEWKTLRCALFSLKVSLSFP